MIIAIDGTSGSGKSTLAKKLAKTLNFGFFSAGALYRAITYKALKLNISDSNDEALKNLIETTKVYYVYDGEKNVMEIDGINITDHLHDEIISSNVAKYSCKPYIREFVRKLQRDTQNHNENIVMEGRDIGSVIFPNAEMKVFVDCKVEERAKRRFRDYAVKDPNVTFEQVLEDLKERDYKDMHREISPLVMCENAYLIDSTLNSVDECLELILNEMLRRELINYDFLKEKGIELQ